MFAAWHLTHRADLAWSAGIVLGYLAGHWALDAGNVGVAAAIAKSLQPHEARDWLPLAMLLAVIPTLVAGTSRRGDASAWFACAVLCLALPWRLLAGSVYLPAVQIPHVEFDTGAWSPGEAILWIVGIGTALFASWRLLAAADGTDRNVRSVLAVSVVLGSVATVGLSGSFTYAQLLGVLAAALAGCATTAAMLRLPQGLETAAGPIVAAFGGILVVAHFYSELLLLHFGLLLLAMAIASGRLIGLSSFSHRVQATVRCVLCLTPLVAAVALAASDFSATQVETPTNPYLDFQR